MANYKTMYTKLFNNVTDAIALLQAAQVKTEDMYLSQEEPDVVVLDGSDGDE